MLLEQALTTVPQLARSGQGPSTSQVLRSHARRLPATAMPLATISAKTARGSSHRLLDEQACKTLLQKNVSKSSIKGRFQEKLNACWTKEREVLARLWELLNDSSP